MPIGLILVTISHNSKGALSNLTPLTCLASFAAKAGVSRGVVGGPGLGLNQACPVSRHHREECRSTSPQVVASSGN